MMNNCFYQAVMGQARDSIFVIAADGGIIDANQAASAAYGYSPAEFRRLSVYDLRLPETRQSIASQLRQAWQAGILFRTTHVRKSGEPFPVEVSSRRFQLENKETIVSIIRDITDTLAKESELLRQHALMSLLHKTALGLMNRHSAGELLRRIVVSAAALAGTPHAFIYQLDKERHVFYQSHGLGTFAGKSELVVPVDQGMAGTVYRTGRPLIANHFEKWRSRYPASAQFTELCAVLQIPLKAGGKVAGILGLAYCEEQKRFGGNELELVSRLADLASIVLENARLIRSMSRIAYYDALTGLPNRAYLQERLAKEMNKTRRGGAPGIVLLIGIDDLKMINDTLGHAAGDALIAEAGAILLAAAGKQAIVARTGGDEFMVLLPGAGTQAEAGRLADTMVSLLDRIYEIGKSLIHMTVSIGVTAYPADGDTAGAIFKCADLALYAAKKSGKNTWRVYEQSLQTAAYERMVLKNDLHEAIERGELSLFYQPLVALADKRVVGFEALLRWTSPQHGAVPPGRFIPLAEESDLIQKIGGWVIREACRFARKLTALGKGDLLIAVNISPHQLMADDFVAKVCEIIGETGITPSQLEFEITENALLDSLEDGNTKFRALRQLGISLSLDDFGTGYSSLTYLRGLPVRVLKLDKSFIDPIAADESQLRFISSIIDMAHVLQLAVVAEGVETEAQLAKLLRCGCDYIQGYVFSRPLPADEAIGYLGR